jgi:hypothetical protein
MLGRAQGVEALHGLKDARKKAGKYHGITEANARAQLKALGVHYRMQATGKRSTKLIRESLAAGRGVVVGVDLPKGKHAVIVTELTKAEARIVDPNEPTVGVVLPRYLFDQLWDGWALSILE